MSNFVFVVRFLYTIRWCHDKATGSWGPKQLAFFGYDVGSIHTYANKYICSAIVLIQKQELCILDREKKFLIED
jgi:hypothetical protein